MNLSDFLDPGFSKGVWGALLGLFLVLTCAPGCKPVAREPDPAMINRALVWGEMRGREVAFYAQELTMIHPDSDRSRQARRVLLELDSVLRGESLIEDAVEEIE